MTIILKQLNDFYSLFACRIPICRAGNRVKLHTFLLFLPHFTHLLVALRQKKKALWCLFYLADDKETNSLAPRSRQKRLKRKESKVHNQKHERESGTNHCLALTRGKQKSETDSRRLHQKKAHICLN